MLSKFCAAIPIVADDDFEEALQGTWSSNPVITVATLDTEISDLTATGAAFVAGMLTLLSGFPTLNTSSNVGRIGYNGSTITGPNFVLNASFNINNNLRAQKVVGNIGAVGIGNGEFTVTGQLQTYFGDASVYNQILNNTLTSFDMRLGRDDGNRETLLFDFPSIKLSSGAPAVPGKNQDVTIQAGFQAFMHATLGYTCWLAVFGTCPRHRGGGVRRSRR